MHIVNVEILCTVFNFLTRRVKIANLSRRVIDWSPIRRITIMKFKVYFLILKYTT